MPDIPFTQFLRPDGRRADVTIDRPDEIYKLAVRIMAAGYRFECEHLNTGHVSFTVTNDDDDQAVELVLNGRQVPAAVDRLITKFAKRMGYEA